MEFALQAALLGAVMGSALLAVTTIYGWSLPAAPAADPHLRAGLNIHRGKVTHPAVAESLGLAFADPAGIAA